MGSIRDEFQRKNWLFGYDQPARYGSSRWGSGIIYVIYRTLMLLFFIASYIYILSTSTTLGYHLIFLTLWSFIVLCINLLFLWIASIRQLVWNKKKREEDEKRQETDKFHILTWIVYYVALAASPLVTLGYWTFLNSGSTVTFSNITVHGVNTIATFLDLCICAIPIRLLHFWPVSIYGCMYVIFTAIYWAAGGTSPSGGSTIYPMLDWGNAPGLTVAWSLALVIGFVFLHMLMFLGAKLLELMADKCKCGKSPSVHAVNDTNISTIA